jgi:beta-N-acetylhexosaminidase
VAQLSPDQRAGQLIMVGLDAKAGRASLDALMARRHLGGAILLGGWYGGADEVRRATRHLAGLATPASKAGLGLLLAADQEGGAVQQLRGPGFTRFPTALEQGKVSPAQLTATGATMGRELRAAGINVNLAPVADTVPSELGRQNAPIGRWGRELSNDPDRVARMVPALVAGLEAGKVASTVKHFPGIGRISGNTDLTATGITDRTTSATDPHVKPFASGIEAGADLVMVSSAIYPRLDPGTNAVFSRKIVTDLLRGRLGFDGVVITDDVGAAKAVAAVPPGQRAVRTVAAGGDITLTASPSRVTAMHDALTAQMAKDTAFAAKVEAAAQRVVALKASLGLARCP